MTRWIGGLDGCRGAWAGVPLDLDDPARYRAVRVTRAGRPPRRPEAPIRGDRRPIGLQGHATGGRRERRPGRARSPGAGPGERVSGAGRAQRSMPPTYEQAKALSRAASPPPFAPSIQCWTLPPSAGRRVATVATGPAIAFTRSIPRSSSAASTATGRRASLARRAVQRRAALDLAPPACCWAPAFPKTSWRSAKAPRRRADDHVDAMAALVVARDVLLGPAPAPCPRRPATTPTAFQS